MRKPRKAERLKSATLSRCFRDPGPDDRSARPESLPRTMKESQLHPIETVNEKASTCSPVGGGPRRGRDGTDWDRLGCPIASREAKLRGRRPHLQRKPTLDPGLRRIPGGRSEPLSVSLMRPHCPWPHRSGATLQTSSPSLARCSPTYAHHGLRRSFCSETYQSPSHSSWWFGTV